MVQWFRSTLLLAGLALTTLSLNAAEPRTAKQPAPAAAVADLSAFRTVETAITTQISRAALQAAPQPGYLGIQADTDGKGRLVIAQVESDSPADRAGLRPGDVVRTVAGQAPTTLAGLRDLLQSRCAGDAVPLTVLRDDRALELSATLDAPSHPLSANSRRAVLGVQLSDGNGGARIDSVVADSPAQEAGLKKDDLIVRADGKDVPAPDRLRLFLTEKQPGEQVALVVRRDGKEQELKVKLAADRVEPIGAPRWDDRLPGVWQKDTYRLAVVLVEFPDARASEKIAARDWERALFSRGTYTTTSATGQAVYGSLNDYYLEQSCGRFHVEGKVFPFIEVGKKRAEYSANSNRYALLTEALDRLAERDGRDALHGFDGLFFVYAGERFPTSRGSLFWPHRSSFTYRGQRWAYFICPEGGKQMSSISVLTHEFGHMLGLPDLYARPESPGSEGLGVWCTMSTGHGRDGKPLHLSAWCKEQLAWLKPTVIDPTVRQKLVLAPVEGSAKECFKVLIRPDGSEYLLLENRTTKGFDRDLPGEGLLIWRVVDGHPVLEESHGLSGPEGPTRFLGSVPYPSRANTAFTPATTPSSKSARPGGLPVHITNIRRLPDGRITFFVGYEYL
jgi:M6 family metalloprotease-like protein